MKVTPTALPEVLILEPKVFADDRGFFFESWNAKAFRQDTGVVAEFVQDNHSQSARNVLRGLHYQVMFPQGKLVRVTSGAVYDVAVDLRRSSPNFGKWVGVELTSDNKRQLWIPPGFAHGFVVRSERADFLYKTTEYWMAEHDRGVRWNDSRIGIEWGIDARDAITSRRDDGAPLLDMAEVFD